MLFLNWVIDVKRIIFHIDVNNAFLSWTAVDMLRCGSSVDIREIASVIGGDEKDRRGIVLAKSPVAKKRGVITAEPLYMARKKCPGLKVFPSDHALYKRESDKLYKYFCTLAPVVERYSIDECFLDFTGTSYLYKDYIELAKKMRDYINKHFGITVNIGIAENKLCAKMASDFEKPNKIHTLFLEEVPSKMWGLPVDDLFMVGKKSAKTLHELGIHTIGQLAKSDPLLLKKYFKSASLSMIEHANGIDDSKVEKYVPKDKSISTTETLPEDVLELEELEKVLLYQADRLGRELRREKQYAGNIAIILKNKDFYSYSHQKKLDHATNITEEIYKTACELLKNTWRFDPIRLIGIRLADLQDSTIYQVNFFESEKDEFKEELQEVLDNINDKYGDLKIMPASMKSDKY